MANIDVTDKASLRAAINSAASGDTILLAPGTYTETFWPSTTTKTLTIAAKNPNSANQPVMRGFSINGEVEGQFVALGGESKGNASNVTFDGLVFQPYQYTEVKQSANDTSPYKLTIPNDGHGGYGWRVDFTFPGNNTTGQSANQKGLVIGGGCSNITVKNCTFYDANCSVTCNGTNCKVIHNTFRYNCEDILRFVGADGALLQYNKCTDFRGLNYTDAHTAYGYSDPGGGTAPPHSDFVQFISNANGQESHGVTINRNYMEEKNGRMHGILMNNPNSGDNNYSLSTKHSDVVITGNEFRMSHATGMILGPTTNIQCRGNKINRAWGSEGLNIMYSCRAYNELVTAVFVPGTVDISNNVCRKFVPSASRTSAMPSDWNIQDNVVINDDTTYPDNWVHIRQEKITGTMEYAGAYGQGGVAPLPGGAPLQDADFNMLGTTFDPALATSDTRQTGVIEIPVGSPVYDAAEIWWGDADDTPMATIYIGMTTGNNKLYRCTSGSTKHLVAQGVAYPSILVYYKMLAADVLSQPSAVTCRFTNPAANDRTLVFVKPKA